MPAAWATAGGAILGGLGGIFGGSDDGGTVTNMPIGPVEDAIRGKGAYAPYGGALHNYAAGVGEGAAPYYGTPPPNQQYAGLHNLQKEGLRNIGDYARSPELAGMIGNTQNALNFGLNAPDVNNNPYLNDYVDAATRPLTQAYEQAIGNTLAGNAAGAGTFGGSRHGIAEGLTGRSYMDAMQDTSTNIFNNAYNKGLDHQARMASLAPQLTQMGTMPGNLLGQVGQIRRDDRQARMNNRYNNRLNQWGYGMDAHNYNSNIDFERNRNFFNDLMSNTGGFGTTTGPDPNASNWLANMAGGASLGYGIWDNWNQNQPPGGFTGSGVHNSFASNPGSGNGVNSMWGSSSTGGVW